MKRHRRLSNVDEVKEIKVIRVKSLVGRGTKQNPSRQITEYFSLDGKRLARVTQNDNFEEIHDWYEYEEDKERSYDKPRED